MQRNFASISSKALTERLVTQVNTLSSIDNKIQLTSR